MEFQAVLEAVRALPMDDQVRLVDQIREDLETDADLTAAQKTELLKRMAEHKANPASGIPWERVLAEARARHKK
jgi:putative addiction module component (TIGR02574 family)